MRRVAVVGLGIMGGSIARHLAHDGFSVDGYDINAKARESAEDHGIRTAATFDAEDMPKGLVVLSLASFSAVSSVLSLLRAAKTPLTILDTSTLSIEDKFAAAGLLDGTQHCLLDCPISGTGAQMASRDVVIYASGDTDAIRGARPVFAAIAQKTINLGAFGNGTKAKLIANYLVAVHNVATAEAMRLGEAAGLEPETLMEAVRSGAGNSRIFELRAPLIARGHYSPPTMKLSVWAKDMAAIAAFADSVGVGSALLEAIDPLYRRAVDEGHGELDTAAVALALPRVPPGDNE